MKGFTERLSLEEQERLYQTYYQNVYNTIYHFSRSKELAEELTHEAYLMAFQKIHMIQDMEKFKGWVCTIGLNLAKDYIRRNKRMLTVENLELFTSLSYSVEEDVMEKLEQERVKKAIDELDNHYKNVIILRYYDDLSYKDIAERLRLNSGTVKTRMNRAKGKLHHLLLLKDLQMDKDNSLDKKELPVLSAM